MNDKAIVLTSFGTTLTEERKRTLKHMQHIRIGTYTSPLPVGLSSTEYRSKKEKSFTASVPCFTIWHRKAIVR